MSSQILFETRGCLAIATLNRPEALNAQNLAMVQAFATQLQVWEADPAITRLLVYGAGDKAFCAGGDVKALWSQDDDARLAFFTHEYALCAALQATRLETVAYMDGITMGGGVGLSIHARHRLATPATRWAMPESKIGFFLDIAASHFLNHVTTPALGRYLALTGISLDGAECLQAGIATHYIDSGRGKHLANILASDTPVVQALAAQQIAPPLGWPLPRLPAGFADLPLPQALAELQERSLLPNGLCAFSQAVIDEALRRGRQQDFAATVTMDHRLVRHFLAGETFPEGVRARLIDKDNRPSWAGQMLDQVDPAEVSRFFTDC